MTDAPGQAQERERIVRAWVSAGAEKADAVGEDGLAGVGRAGGVLAARLVGVLESVERLPVLAPHGDAPPPAQGTLHHLTKRIRYVIM